MISKQQIKFIQSLRLKKYRQEHQMFVVEGAKIVLELLQSNFKIFKIYGLSQWIDRQTIKNNQTSLFQIVTESELKQISELSNPNEVLAIAYFPIESSLNIEEGTILGLQSIRDPGNLGTIIRTADWYGIKQIICSEDCADIFNSKVVQASMGSIFRVKVCYCELIKFLSETKLTKYAATLHESISLHEFKNLNPGILLIGNESKGLSSELIDLCDYKLSIPRLGSAESLNAAVATGIFLDWLSRKK